jgi:uncharacterized protein YciI
LLFWNSITCTQEDLGPSNENSSDDVKLFTAVLLFGRTQNSDARTFGLAIFRTESQDEARSIMNNDPAVKKGVVLAELYSYKVAGLNAREWQAD